MGKGADLGTHFMDDHFYPEMSGLPRSLGTGHAAANDVKFCCFHNRALSVVDTKWEELGYEKTALELPKLKYRSVALAGDDVSFREPFLT